MFQCLRIDDQLLGGGGGFAFFAIATLFHHLLGQHADVTDHLDARIAQNFYGGRFFLTAFEFHGIGTGIDKLSSGNQRLIGSVVGMNRQVAQHQSAGMGTRHGGGVMDHVRQRDMRGIGKTEHHHA